MPEFKLIARVLHYRYNKEDGWNKCTNEEIAAYISHLKSEVEELSDDMRRIKMISGEYS